jgi:hypothetical protein
MRVAMAAFTAFGVRKAVNAKDSMTTATPNMIVVRVFICMFLFLDLFGQPS